MARLTLQGCVRQVVQKRSAMDLLMFLSMHDCTARSGARNSSQGWPQATAEGGAQRP